MRVRAKNFLSWAELDFEFGSGVTLVRGYNFDDGTEEGSGKSAILNAVSWCLFGEIPKEANVDEVIKEGTKHCEVAVYFPEFTVVRARNPNDLRIENVNGGIFRGKDAIETKKEVIKRVGMSFVTFCQSIYFAQNYPKKFVLANQDDKGKILSEILDLEQFERARKLAAERMKPIRENLAKAETSFQVAGNNVKHEDHNCAEYEQLIRAFEQAKVENIQKLIREYDSINSEAENFIVEFNAKRAEDLRVQNEKIAEVKRILKDSRAELKDLGEAKELKSETKALEEKLEAVEAIGNNAKIKLSTAHTENSVHNRRKEDLFSAVNKLVKTEAGFEHKKSKVVTVVRDLEEAELCHAAALAASEFSLPNKTCPTCGQPWTGDPEHFRKEVRKTQADVTRAHRAVKDLEEDLDLLEKDIIAQRGEIEHIKGEVENFKPPKTENLRKIVTSASEDCTVIKKALKELKEKESKIDLVKYRITLNEKQEAEQIYKREEIMELSPASAMERFQKRQKALETEIEIADASQPDALRKKLRGAQERHAEAVKEYDTLQAQVENLKASLTRLEASREGFREVKAYTFENTLRLLTSKANAYLAQLFNQQVKIRFKNEDLKIETTVQIDGQERPLGLYSGGQFRRIALAVDLALADITLSRKGNKLNLMIMDEYFKDLSATSMARILKILQARKTPTILIEHNDVFKSIVAQTFDVELRNGTSSAKM